MSGLDNNNEFNGFGNIGAFGLNVTGPANAVAQPIIQDTKAAVAASQQGFGEAQAANQQSNAISSGALQPFISNGTTAYNAYLSALGLTPGSSGSSSSASVGNSLNPSGQYLTPGELPGWSQQEINAAGYNNGINPATAPQQGYYQNGVFNTLNGAPSNQYSSLGSTFGGSYFDPNNATSSDMAYGLTDIGDYQQYQSDLNSMAAPQLATSLKNNPGLAQNETLAELNANLSKLGYLPTIAQSLNGTNGSSGGGGPSQRLINEVGLGQATSDYDNAHGITPPPSQYAPSANQPSAASQIMTQLQNSPGYQFMLNQGLQGINQSAAAQGLLGSGAQGQALTQYGQNYAENYYNNYLNQLSQAAGIGGTAAGQLASNATSSGNALQGSATSAGGTQAGLLQSTGNDLTKLAAGIQTVPGTVYPLVNSTAASAV